MAALAPGDVLPLPDDPQAVAQRALALVRQLGEESQPEVLRALELSALSTLFVHAEEQSPSQRRPSKALREELLRLYQILRSVLGRVAGSSWGEKLGRKAPHAEIASRVLELCDSVRRQFKVVGRRTGLPLAELTRAEELATQIHAISLQASGQPRRMPFSASTRRRAATLLTLAWQRAAAELGDRWPAPP